MPPSATSEAFFLFFPITPDEYFRNGMKPVRSSHLRRPPSGSGRPPARKQPLRRSRRRKLVLLPRPAGIPRLWRPVDDGQKRTAPASIPLVEQWLMILASRNIPYRTGGRRRLRVYVPAFLENLARTELAAVAAEAHSTPADVPVPAHRNAHWVLFLFLLLILWHGIRMGWTLPGPIPGLPSLAPDTWLHLGAVDVFRVIHEQEWYRCVTGLTLHADSEHLFGNVLFGTPFLVLLCRRTGLGVGILLVLVAGTLGNGLNVLYRPSSHVSLGFSTALFGAVGTLSGLLALSESTGNKGMRKRALRRGLVLLAAGAASLAMLGTEGVRTDYAAHLFGLLAGFFTGGSAALLVRHFGEPSASVQWISGILVLSTITFCWKLAL